MNSVRWGFVTFAGCLGHYLPAESVAVIFGGLAALVLADETP